MSMHIHASSMHSSSPYFTLLLSFSLGFSRISMSFTEDMSTKILSGLLCEYQHNYELMVFDKLLPINLR